MNYDIIVVGGRVSGSISSLFASKNGADVLMIEKHQEIGTPVQCAGGVSDSFFKHMEMDPLSHNICTRVEGAKINTPDGNSISAKNKGLYGYILERKLFDKDLAIKSADAGTDIMLKTTLKDLIIENGTVKGVVVRHNGELIEIRSKIVIAADGVESQTAKKAGLDTHFKIEDLCSCAQYEMVGLDVDTNLMEFHFGSNISPGGYIWIFPKGGNRANVGIGVRNSPGNAHYYLQKFISQLNATPVEFNVGAVPVGGPVKKTYTDGLLVVGDAAGQVDPLTGGGIHISAKCGKIAGEISAEAIKKEDTSSKFLKKYENSWKKNVGSGLEKSLKYRKIFDKLTDEDLNNLLKAIQDQNLDSVSTFSLLKMVKGYPQLLKLLRSIL
ncbi:geranylgeranyl reductase family protein [Methanobacterium alcaliphilum]|uniref:geranylgeranyl reductase family protein n=1 Tax=Methanobacterium alcaliphilum TaxID=392018 RepID=UPI00200A427C|nr:NAD(P)/FAD-dependent oxidoreductase [Methanobacterium alcaliphilum]MCK9152170.1 NAD(P)/FAD-dependent oxidoreductase [Methanobacterium alcaliphilum]